MNSQSIVKTFDFEGKPLTCIEFDGRPAFIAKEVGERLGYADEGGQITTIIGREWKNSFIEGKHYSVITGQELSDLKQILSHTEENSVCRTARLMILFEPGVHMVAIRSNKPEARRLHDFLAEQVLPQLVRDGRYSPDRHVDEQGRLHGSENNEVYDKKEQRLLAMEERLAKQLRVKGWNLAIRIAQKNCKPELVSVYETKVAEVLTDEKLSALLPVITTADWKSPEQIGEEFGVTSHRVGLASSAIWGRQRKAIDGIMESRMNKASHCDKLVPSWFYSPKAVEEIVKHLRGEKIIH